MALDLVTGDLRHALPTAGFEPHRPALFTVEGLLSYLRQEDTERLLTQLRELAAPQSRLALAVPLVRSVAGGVAHLRVRLRDAALAAIGEPHLHRFSPEQVAGVLTNGGWAIVTEAGAPLRFEGSRGVLLLAAPSP